MFWLESFKDVKYLKNSDEIIQKLEDMKKAFNEYRRAELSANYGHLSRATEGK